jgi:hypothetical protein
MVSIPTANNCGTQTCPSPPVSEAEDLDSYCPSWVQQLRTTTLGKLVLKAGASCLYTLKSKCSGWLYFDASTENVKVDANPPFVRDNPQTTAWGFIAKVLNRPQMICKDGFNDCPMEGRQELAAQLVEKVQKGQIAIITKPECGTVPIADSADLNKQVGIHELDPREHTSCKEAEFLVRIGGTCDAPEWAVMRQIKMPISQLGKVTTSELASAKPVLWVRSGGTEENPCYILKLNDRSANNELPANAGNCEIAVFNSESGIWEAKKRGLSYYAIGTSFEDDNSSVPDGDWTSSINMASATDLELANIPPPLCPEGDVFVDIEIWQKVQDGASGTNTGGNLTIDGQIMLATISDGAGRRWRTVRLNVTGKTKLSLRSFRTFGNGTIWGAAKILGYLA